MNKALCGCYDVALAEQVLYHASCVNSYYSQVSHRKIEGR